MERFILKQRAKQFIDEYFRTNGSNDYKLFCGFLRNLAENVAKSSNDIANIYQMINCCSLSNQTPEEVAIDVNNFCSNLDDILLKQIIRFFNKNTENNEKLNENVETLSKLIENTKFSSDSMKQEINKLSEGLSATENIKIKSSLVSMAGQLTQLGNQLNELSSEVGIIQEKLS
jgi:replicative superfamily II helicase